MAAVTHFDSVEVLQNGALLGWCLDQLHFLAGIEMRSSMYLQTSTSLTVQQDTIQLENWR